MDFNFCNNKVTSVRLCAFNIQTEFVISIYREFLRTFNNTCSSSYGKIGSATENQIQGQSSGLTFPSTLSLTSGEEIIKYYMKFLSRNCWYCTKSFMSFLSLTHCQYYHHM